MSCKLLYPRQTFSAKNKMWSLKLRTSDESMALTIKRAHANHASNIEFMRRKMDLPTVTSLSQKAVFVLSAAADVLKVAPVSPEKVQNEWVTAWQEGSEQVDMEVSAALLEQNEAGSGLDMCLPAH